MLPTLRRYRRSLLRRVSRLSGIALTLALGSGVPGAEGQTPAAESTSKGKRPGKYRIGAFYLTPRFVIGPIGFDSNVLYSAVDRQADVTLSAGPGLDVVLPFGRGGRFYTTGTLNYLYFVRTESQRRLTGSAAGGLATEGGRVEVFLEEQFATSFGRPSYEIDERVEQRTEGTSGQIRSRLFGRFGLLVEGRRERNQSDTGEDYLGTDVGGALTRDMYRTAGELSYRLSVKSALVGRAEFQWNRFPREDLRDSDLRLFAGGFRTESTALIAGHALAGTRSYKARASADERQITWLDLAATWSISRRTRLGGYYSRDLRDSFFVPADGLPAYLAVATSLRLEKDLTSRIDLRLYAKRTHYLTDAPVTIVDPDEGPVTAIRDDITREAGADLGYRVRRSFRVGIVASYVDRDSSFASFGIQGFLVGVNAQFDP